MSHPFNYRVDGTALVATTGVDNVRLKEGVAGKRAQLLETAYRHGAYVAERHWTKARLMQLDVLLPGGTPTDIYTVRDDVDALLAGGVRTLARNHPVQGEVQCRILAMDPVEQPEGPQRFHWRWPLWQLDGYWEAAAAASVTDLGLAASGSLTQLTLGGNHPISPKFTITCQADGSDPKITDPTTLDEVFLPGAYTAGDVLVVDLTTQQLVVTLNGVRHKNALKPNRGYIMEFDPQTNGTPTLTWESASGSWDVTTEWRNRYRG